MRTENALSRVNNLIRPWFVGGVEGSARGILRELRGVITARIWDSEATGHPLARHRNQRNCLRRRHERPTSSIRMREGLRTKASILPHPPSLYRLRSGILTHFANPLQSPFLPQWRENKITSLSSEEEDVSASVAHLMQRANRKGRSSVRPGEEGEDY